MSQEGIMMAPLWSFVASLKRIASPSDFIHIISWFDKCILATGQGQTIPGDKILMSTETSCHFGHLLQVSKKSLWSLILYNFFHHFIHVYSPGVYRGRGWQPLGMKFWCQQEHLVTSVICCKFKKNLFEVWFYTNFFMILYMYIALGQGQSAPRGQILMSTERPCHPFVASFKEISLKFDFIQFYFKI